MQLHQWLLPIVFTVTGTGASEGKLSLIVKTPEFNSVFVREWYHQSVHKWCPFLWRALWTLVALEVVALHITFSGVAVENYRGPHYGNTES